jgi:hypothetical protein
MKNFRILFFGLLLTGISVQAQNLYLRAGAGVAMSTSAFYIADYTNTTNSYTATMKKQGFGTGLPFVLAAGYNLNEHFSLELGVDYFYGFTIKQKAENTFSSFNSYETKMRGKMLSIVPAFVVHLPLDKFKPYARLGVKLGVVNSVVSKKHEVNTSSGKSTAATDIQSKSKEYGGIALGVQAAVGTDFPLSDRLSLFGEIQVDGISYSPTHGKYTEYIVNGVDKLNDRTVRENTWDYVKEVSYPSNIPDDQPDQFGKINQPFGNVGLVLGVKINL